LQKREVRTTAVTVESIRCSPPLEQPFEVSNAEAAIRELFQKRLIAEVLNDFIYEGKAGRWKRSRRRATPPIIWRSRGLSERSTLSAIT
jgi:hypothetical protein